MKIYIVWYDNGMSYEDREVTISKIFASLDDAKAYAEEQSAVIERGFKPSKTKEQYYAQPSEDIYMSYEDWVSHEAFTFEYYNQGEYRISEEIVH